MHFGKTSFLVALVTATFFAVPATAGKYCVQGPTWVIRATVPIRQTRNPKHRLPAPSMAAASTRATPMHDRAAIPIAGRAAIE